MPASVPTADEFNALAARVTALESGSVKPPDPPNPSQPSPDGTTITTVGPTITTAKGNTYALYANAAQGGNGITYNGTPDAATHHVGKLYAKGGLCYQQETTRGDWYVGNEPGWTYTSDPTAVTPPIPPNPNPSPSGYVGLYTSSPGGEAWNWGNGYDSQLAQGIAIFEQESGHTVTAYDIFPTWGDQNWWASNLKNMLWAMAGNAKGKTLMPMVGVKMFWSNTPPQNYGWNDPQGFRDNIAGKYDAVWSGMVDACVDCGYTTAAFRISYEHNFSFMPDSPGWDSGNQQLWKQAFEHISSVIRAQAQKRGATALILFNPTLGGGSQPVESFQPSPASYDIAAVDCYNGYYPGHGETRTDFWSNTYYGMNHHLALAKAAGKPVLFPEIGAGTRPDGHGMANDTEFWDWVDSSATSLVRANGLRMAGLCFWDVPASDINARMSNGAQPPCMARVNAHLASGSFVGDALQASDYGATP